MGGMLGVQGNPPPTEQEPIIANIKLGALVPDETPDDQAVTTFDGREEYAAAETVAFNPGGDVRSGEAVLADVVAVKTTNANVTEYIVPDPGGVPIAFRDENGKFKPLAIALILGALVGGFILLRKKGKK